MAVMGKCKHGTIFMFCNECCPPLARPFFKTDLDIEREVPRDARGLIDPEAAAEQDRKRRAHIVSIEFLGSSCQARCTCGWEGNIHPSTPGMDAVRYEADCHIHGSPFEVTAFHGTGLPAEACDLTDRREKPVSLFHGTPLTEHRSSSWYEGPETNSASYRCSCGWAGELYDNSSVCKSASAFEEASHHKASHENCNWASLAPFDEVAAEQYRVLLSLVREPDGACYCSPGYAQAQWKEPQIAVLYRSARQYAGGIYSEFYWALATETKGWEGFDDIHSLFADPAFRAEHQLEQPTEAQEYGQSIRWSDPPPSEVLEEMRVYITETAQLREQQNAEILFHGTPGLRHYEMLSETIDDTPGGSSILAITRDIARGK